MKVIFLDIDGVLNWRGTDDRILGYIGFDPERIARFNRITAVHPDAKIVISSTWRHTFAPESLRGQPGAYFDLQGLVDLLHSRGLVGDVIGQTPAKMSLRTRGGEIRMWVEDYLEKHADTDATLEILVLDDDAEEMEGTSWPASKWGPAGKTIDLRPFHVRTDFNGYEPKEDAGPEWEEGGLQDRHVDLAIAVLHGATVPFDDPWVHAEEQ